MSDNNDDNQNFALAVVAGVVALVIAGVIALAASTVIGAPPATAAAAAPAAEMAPPAATNEAAGAPERLYFEVGSPDLPADASEVLTRVAEAARASAGATVLISGFHDASGDPAQNAELAKNRALAVRHALEANGVAPERLVMSKPAVTTGGGGPKEARRVELRVQP
jgi:outer membrane protein OmpA-like peptidoglycan-associated protein